MKTCAPSTGGGRPQPAAMRLHDGTADFTKDSSGRFKARSIGRKRQTLFIPWFEPGQEIPVPTKDARERRLLGRWMAALNTAGRSDFSKIDKFPRNTSIGGVTLPTSRKDVQRLLEALAERNLPTKACTARLRGRHERADGKEC